MKKAGFFTLLLLPFFFFTKFPVYAENVTTGNASAKNYTKTEIERSSNVATHIETTANGKTEVIDSNESGEIEVRNNNGNVMINKSSQASTSQTLTSTSSPRTKSMEHKKTFILNFLEIISNFFKRIFTNL